ncbi:MAG: HAMP domain-containing protein [Planctomycetaceae bacterium]|jgi:nitrogen fixation/metabolism regulation signal transduction histidine kinase|nr:HAMP domain-containing protein [Planctomycetaceae bacterium]
MEWQPLSAVLYPIYQRLQVRLVVYTLGLLCTVGLIAVIAHRITHPLKELVRFALKLADGNLDATVQNVNTGDEIQRLAEVFNQMTVSLKKVLKKQSKAEPKPWKHKTRRKQNF